MAINADNNDITVVPLQATERNPITGVFGKGKVTIFTNSGTFTASAITARVRAWGAGGMAGGGFVMKVLSGLVIGQTYAVTVGKASTSGGDGGMSSFSSLISATGGNGSSTQYPTGGTGVGGDINTTGGKPSGMNGNGPGGGAANLFGNGAYATRNGTSGGGGLASGSSSSSRATNGGSGISGTGGLASIGANPGQPGIVQNVISIDHIGTGPGGGGNVGVSVLGQGGDGANGGGGGNGVGGSGAHGGNGGFPGGGSGNDAIGGDGLVIVEE